MSFLDFLKQKNKKGIMLFDSVFLLEGEGVNIYGDTFVGKTTFCFYIIKQNKNKKVAYVCSEHLSERYQKKLNSMSENIYIINCFDIDWLLDIITIAKFDVVIIDSLTALNYIDNKKKLLELFDILIEKKMNFALVSQMREMNGKKYYEHKKLLDVFTYKVLVEKAEDKMLINKQIEIKYEEVWNKH